MSDQKPLTGIRILDFTSTYAGPVCSRLFADCGAEVLKVEPPEIGDITRGSGSTEDFPKRHFAHFNAGKSSIVIDLKSKKGQEIATRLSSQVDVVLENNRPGIMQKLGLSYDSLSAHNPKLIYCSISGFGQDGPLATRAAYAPVIHAASGYDLVHAAVQGDPEMRPPNCNIMTADILSGVYSFGAIQAALLSREKTDKGAYIDMSMLDAMMSLIPVAMQAMQLPELPPPGGWFSPCKTRDGHIMIVAMTPKSMQGLANAMGQPDLFQDTRLLPFQRWQNHDVWTETIENWTRERTSKECEDILSQEGVPCSLYNTPDELLSHPHLHERGSFKKTRDSIGDYLLQNPPFKFDNQDVSTNGEVPMLGEHTREKLKDWLQMSDQEVDELIEEKAVAQH